MNILEDITLSQMQDGKKMFYHSNDAFVGQSFIKNGRWYDSKIISIVDKYRIKNKNILDIGGFIGTVCIRLYDKIKNEQDTKIHVFEPRYHYCLKKNIEINNMEDRIILHPVGLANNNGYIKDHLGGNPDIRSFASQPIGVFVDKNKKEVPIGSQILNTKDENCFELRKLDSFNLTNIGFIKIDAESFEIEIIKGAIETLKNNNYPPLYIELLGGSDGINADPHKILYDKHSIEVTNILKNIGYLMDTPFVPGTHNDYLFIHKSQIP